MVSKNTNSVPHERHLHNNSQTNVISLDELKEKFPEEYREYRRIVDYYREIGNSGNISEYLLRDWYTLKLEKAFFYGMSIHDIKNPVSIGIDYLYRDSYRDFMIVSSFCHKKTEVLSPLEESPFTREYFDSIGNFYDKKGDLYIKDLSNITYALSILNYTEINLNNPTLNLRLAERKINFRKLLNSLLIIDVNIETKINDTE